MISKQDSNTVSLGPLKVRGKSQNSLKLKKRHGHVETFSILHDHLMNNYLQIHFHLGNLRNR